MYYVLHCVNFTRLTCKTKQWSTQRVQISAVPSIFLTLVRLSNTSKKQGVIKKKGILNYTRISDAVFTFISLFVY